MPATVLTLERRHGPRCPAGHKKGSFTYVDLERRHNAKRCTCPIYGCGTFNGIFQRFATRRRDVTLAWEVLAPYLEARSWDITPGPPPPPHSGEAVPDRGEVEKTAGLPVADAVKKYRREQETNLAAFSTRRKTGEILRAFELFSADHGLRYLEEWTPDWVRDFRASWGNGPRTTSTKLGRLKPFFEMFVENKTLAFNPARLREPRTLAFRQAKRGSRRQVNPFTDPELERQLVACSSYGRIERRWPQEGHKGRPLVSISEYRRYPRKWTGEDLADFIDLSVHTGLRISDIATFDISRLAASGEVRVRATKNGEWVSVWIPDELQARIRARAARVGPLIFGRHQTGTSLDSITEQWRKRLKRVWALAGPWESTPTPHRYRHTFVRILLERHVPVSEIANLTGDTEQMIRKHYSAWIPGRQEATTRILQEAFRNVPRFHSS